MPSERLKPLLCSYTLWVSERGLGHINSSSQIYWIKKLFWGYRYKQYHKYQLQAKSDRPLTNHTCGYKDIRSVLGIRDFNLQLYHVKYQIKKKKRKHMIQHVLTTYSWVLFIWNLKWCESFSKGFTYQNIIMQVQLNYEIKIHGFKSRCPLIVLCNAFTVFVLFPIWFSRWHCRFNTEKIPKSKRSFILK